METNAAFLTDAELRQIVQNELLALYSIKPSEWTIVDTLRFHTWLDEMLTPYVERLEKKFDGQQKFGIPIK